MPLEAFSHQRHVLSTYPREKTDLNGHQCSGLFSTTNPFFQTAAGAIVPVLNQFAIMRSNGHEHNNRCSNLTCPFSHGTEMKNYSHHSPPHRYSLLLANLLKFVAASLVIICAAAASARSQSEPTKSQSDPAETNERMQEGWNEFGVWGGISFHAPTLIGKTPAAMFGNIGLRYGRVLAASNTVAFEYTIDAVPVASLWTKKFTLVPTSPGVFSVKETRESVYAAGLSPIGFKLNFRRQKQVQVFASSTGGFLYFQDQVPVSGAARFNFTYDFSGGVQLVNTNRRSFLLGYKYQHISNGFTSPINPGVDVQMVFAGFSIFR